MKMFVEKVILVWKVRCNMVNGSSAIAQITFQNKVWYSFRFRIFLLKTGYISYHVHGACVFSAVPDAIDPRWRQQHDVLVRGA